MALGLTQPLTEMSTRNVSWLVKAAGAYVWTYHPHMPTVLKSESRNLLEPSGPVQACIGIAFTFYHLPKIKVELSLLHAKKSCWESEGVSPLILNLDNRWRWAVKFTLSPP